VQANALWTAMHGAQLRQPSTAVALLLVALLALVAPLVGLRLPALAAGVAVPVAAGLFLVAAQLAFDDGVILNAVSPLAALVVAGVGTIAWSQLAESRARRAVTRDNELLEARVRERTQELWETQIEVVQRLGTAVDWRDAETGHHIQRIGHFCERLALEIGMEPADAELLRHASALHDVGKVGIPDGILTKPGRLTDEERETMKTHTTIGGNILSGSASELVRLAQEIALTHHEHWDGNGYPNGVSGERIPLAGRICAICDVFDALLSTRPYKEAWSIDRALEEIERVSGSQFDPGLVQAFVPIAHELHREWFGADDSVPSEERALSAV
jgi:response regulator RpfG family c-di-GMP phosphodiesterase